MHIFCVGHSRSKQKTVTLTDQKIEVVSASQSSTYDNKDATLAIDSDMETFSHTQCNIPETWFRMEFSGVRCVGHIDIYPSHDSYHRRRLGGTVVIVENSILDTQTICGRLELVDNVQNYSPPTTVDGITNTTHNISFFYSLSAEFLFNYYDNRWWMENMKTVLLKFNTIQ